MQLFMEKIAIFDKYLVLASMTAGSSRMINIWMIQYSSYHVSVDRVGTANKIH